MQNKKLNNLEVLNKIYENAQMGTNSITYVSEKTDDTELLKELQNELQQYNEVSAEASQKILELNEIPKETGPMAQVGLWSSVQMNTLMDKSTSHIAEMMMQGNAMGVIDMAKTIKNAENKSTDAEQLAQKLIETEENNFQNMKQFL